MIDRTYGRKMFVNRNNNCNLLFRALFYWTCGAFITFIRISQFQIQAFAQNVSTHGSVQVIIIVIYNVGIQKSIIIIINNIIINLLEVNFTFTVAFSPFLKTQGGPVQPLISTSVISTPSPPSGEIHRNYTHV